MAEKSILVLKHDDIRVFKWPFCYVVGVLTTTKGGVEYVPEWSRTYHKSLEDAIENVSERLFERKLDCRAKAGATDFGSLVMLVRNHKKIMETVFGI